MTRVNLQLTKIYNNVVSPIIFGYLLSVFPEIQIILTMRPKLQILYLSQIFLVVAPASILYGYNQAGLSALLDLPDVVRYFPQVDTINTTGTEEARNSTIKGLVNACLQLRGLVGALSCLAMGGAFGCRKSILLADLLALIGQILQFQRSPWCSLLLGGSFWVLG